jgi:uncharacterized glyoxalase superfamily protein PhnB
MFYPPNELPANRSIPFSPVIPVLAYPNVREAVEWLSDVFGFSERLQIADHRSQMKAGEGGIIIAEYMDRDRRPEAGADYVSHGVMVRVADVQSHYEHAAARGAEILEPPFDHIYGERQYSVKDIGGHRWTFSQTLSDADPDMWGRDHGVTLKPV